MRNDRAARSDRLMVVTLAAEVQEHPSTMEKSP